MTVASLVAATTVRVVAGGDGAIWEDTEAASDAPPSSNIPAVLNRMITSHCDGSSKNHLRARRRMPRRQQRPVIGQAPAQTRNALRRVCKQAYNAPCGRS